MKTAVSIPDDVFEQAERFAKSSKKSRSRVFSDALREYLARRTPEALTQAMNDALASVSADKHGFAAAAARKTLENSEW